MTARMAEVGGRFSGGLKGPTLETSLTQKANSTHHPPLRRPVVRWRDQAVIRLVCLLSHWRRQLAIGPILPRTLPHLVLPPSNTFVNMPQSIRQHPSHPSKGTHPTFPNARGHTEVRRVCRGCQWVPD